MITVYFGSPGSGKTTMAVRELVKNSKFYDYTFSNFECSCCTGLSNVSLDGLGLWSFPPYSYISIDEAGIEYNNRKFKSLSQDTIKWFKLHRHFHCDISIWSQSWEDMDITIRRLADKLYYIRRVGPFTIIRRVYKRVTVDKQTQQIIDGYKMVNMLWLLLKPLYFASFAFFGLGFILRFLCPFDEIKLVLRFPYYRFFDSYSVPADIAFLSISNKGNSQKITLLSVLQDLGQPLFKKVAHLHNFFATKFSRRTDWR